MEDKSIDITWILVASLFMALNTVLWSLSYAEVRRAHPKAEVIELTDLGLQSIFACADRWPGTTSAYGLYCELVQARLKVFDDQVNGQQEPAPCWPEASPTSLSFGAPHSTQSSPLLSGAHQRPSVSSLTSSNGPSPQSSFGYDHQSPASHSYTSGSMASPNYLNVYGEASLNPAANLFNTAFIINPLPFDAAAAAQTSPPCMPPATSYNLPPGSIDTMLPPFSTDFQLEQILHPPMALVPPRRQESLSQAQQQELMETVETDGMQDITQMLIDSENFFKTLSTP
jgi:hypothetical protein